MSKIKSITELQKLRDNLKEKTELRNSEDNNVKVLVGMATCGIAAGARLALTAILDEIDKQGIKGVTVTSCGCMGACYAEPTVEVQIKGEQSVLYGNVTEDKAREIVAKHLKNGEYVQNLIIDKPY